MPETLALKRVRDLHVRAPSLPGRPAFVSAASGLVSVGDLLYIIADDELQLAVFEALSDRPGQLLRVLEGTLPSEPRARKRAKPDFETLTLLPAFGDYAGGALLALGSGSTDQRCRGVLLPLDASGQAEMRSLRILDLSKLYADVGELIGTVNIEGAVATTHELLLLQRGNKGTGVNAVVRMNLHDFCDSARRTDVIPPLAMTARRYDLGAIRDVPLGFSDGAALSDGTIVFAAIAEDTRDAYEDGRCTGAALGMLLPNGDLDRVLLLDPPAKVEGIVLREDGTRVAALLVTDADDPAIPASLYSATFKR